MAVIEQIEIWAVSPKLGIRWTERAQQFFLTTTIVRVTDSDGVAGIGSYDSYSPGQADLSVLEALRSMAPALIGRDPECREAVARDLRIGVLFPFSPGPLSAVDVALWDLAAVRAELPLYRLFGGTRERIAVYASLPTMTQADEYLQVVAKARAEGLGAVKVHAWGDPDRDVGLFEQIRAANPDLALMHDAEGVYDRRGALHVARGLEELDCRWFEAPLPDFDLAGYRDLRRRVDVPILPAGYSMWDLRQFAEALRDPPWTAARSEIGATLGLTMMRKLMVLAEAFDMDLEPVSYGHTLSQVAALHLMLAFDNVSYFELPYPVEPWEFGVANPIRPDAEGMVGAPDGCGLGVALDWEKLESQTVGRGAVRA